MKILLARSTIIFSLVLISLLPAQNAMADQEVLENVMGRKLTTKEYAHLKELTEELDRRDKMRSEGSLEQNAGAPASTPETPSETPKETWKKSYLICGDAKAALVGSYGEGLGCYDYYSKKKYYIFFYKFDVALPNDIKELKKIKNLIPSVTVGLGILTIYLPSSRNVELTDANFNCVQTSVAALVGAKYLRCLEKERTKDDGSQINAVGVQLGRDTTFEEEFEAQLIEYKAASR